MTERRPRPASRAAPSSLRTVASGVLSCVLSFLVVSASGCGTDAVGVDDCRDIETARCEAAQHCGYDDDFDVDSCKRFYRDHCLHGLAIDDSPGDPAVQACVSTIRSAGNCAAEGGSDTTIGDCSAAPSQQTSASTACEIVRFPERAFECSFLSPSAPVPDAGGSGGSGGTSGATGSGGVAGSSAAGAGGA